MSGSKFRFAFGLALLPAGLIFLGALIGLSMAAAADPNTKIAPTAGTTGDDFTIIDTPAGRLIAGAVAVFTDAATGVSTTATLRTHRPNMTAQGTVPASLAGGITYDITVQANGKSFSVGTFQVAGTVVPLSLAPTQGPVGSQFTIADAGQRMQQGDQALFYLPGDDPATGTPATNFTISSDGGLLDGVVPGVIPGLQYYVAVACPNPFTIRFQGLSYFVTP